MKKYLSPLALMALAAASLSSPLAQAASASSALSNVYIQLFDLDPLDGITPSLTFDNPVSLIYGQVIDGVRASYYDSVLMDRAMFNAVTEGGAQAASVVLEGNVWLPASGNGANLSAMAVGLNTSADTMGQLINSQFTVSAKTEVVMTATAQASAAAALGESSYAWAWIGLRDLAMINRSIDGVHWEVDTIGKSYEYGGQREVQVNFVNLTAASQLGYIDARATAM